VESWRPLFAAERLRNAAFKELGLRPAGSVSPVVRELAKKKKIRMTSPQLKFTFKRSEIRDRIKEFSRESLADVECFKVTLDLTEAMARREIENERARAWATADLAGLAALPPLPNPGLPCAMAIANAQVARDLVPADIREQLIAKWLEAAEAGLAANQTTFAVVGFGKLTRPDGYLDRLRAKGYSIESPQ
jgi:TraB/PrgY/gumN family